MKFIKLFLLVLLSGVVFTSCQKEPVYDADKQLATDEELIKSYLSTNNISAERHESGVYYQILEPGTGSIQYGANTKITAKYTLRLLNGPVIPQSTDPIEFSLGRVIPGWQIGIPLIQKGGRIRLFVPSPYAYQNSTQNGIPANSILDFDIELVDVQN